MLLNFDTSVPIEPLPVTIIHVISHRTFSCLFAPNIILQEYMFCESQWGILMISIILNLASLCLISCANDKYDHEI